MAGQTYEEIARSLSYRSPSSALYAVEKALGREPAPEAGRFRKLNLGRLNEIVRIWWPMMVGDRAVATDKVRAAIHDILQLYGLDVPKEPLPGSMPDKPFHVSAVPGQINWDNMPWDLAERFLALNDELLALHQPAGGC